MPGPCRWPPSRASASSSTWPAWIDGFAACRRSTRNHDWSADVLQFVRADLGRGWDEVRRRVLDRCQACGISPEEELGPADRVLSPSDFGFHNALLDRQGNVRFFDFEYAGWDDPAKLVCDFFCQVEVPVPRRLFPSFCAEYRVQAAGTGTRAAAYRRVVSRLPAQVVLYRVERVSAGRPGPPAVQRCVPAARTAAGNAVGKGSAYAGSSGRS